MRRDYDMDIFLNSLFQNHFLRKHRDHGVEDVKEKHLVRQQPTVSALHSGSEDHEIPLEITSEDAEFDESTTDSEPELQTAPDTYTSIADDYGNFLCRLEAVHHVPQRAVGEIASEVLKISSRVLAHTIGQVGTNLGK
jgi:hypothetical protein